MTNIKKQIESVTKLHGGEREQRSKHVSFISWQLAQRAKARGEESSPILKPTDGRVFTHATVEENAHMSSAVRAMRKMKAFT